MMHYDASMRTTLTLDDDVAQALQERARFMERPFKQVVNEALRRGLTPSVIREKPAEYRVAPHSSGLAPGIDPLRLNQINDQLEADAFTRPGAE